MNTNGTTRGIEMYRVALLVLLSLAVSAFPGAGPAVSAADVDSEDSEKSSKRTSKTKKTRKKRKKRTKKPSKKSSKASKKPVEEEDSPAGPSLEDEYVRERLENYLHPTKLSYLDDGRVKLTFNLSRHDEDHRRIFTPPVSEEVNSRFRWSLRYEWGWGWYDSIDRDEQYHRGGLRISMDSLAHLNVWFQDDFEAEIWYVQGVGHNPKQKAALVFTNRSKNSIGSNYGSQAVEFSRGKLRKARGKVPKVIQGQLVRNKLVVRDGLYEVYRNGKLGGKGKYKEKKYSTGKIGFIWGGGLAAFINKFEITGRIDSEKMAKILKKVPSS